MHAPTYSSWLYTGMITEISGMPLTPLMGQWRTSHQWQTAHTSTVTPNEAGIAVRGHEQQERAILYRRSDEHDHHESGEIPHVPIMGT